MPRHAPPKPEVLGEALTLHGSPVLWGRKALSEFRAELKRAQFDLLISIDFQSIYRLPIWLLPRVPVLFWFRDPWGPEDKLRMAGLRLPGDQSPPQGFFSRDLRTFRFDALLARLTRRRFAYAAPAELVFKRIPPTYGIRPPNVHLLPNFFLRSGAAAPKAAQPTVLFIGRFDPVKRPWLVHEIARRLPEVRFEMAGATQLRGAGAWSPESSPPNVVYLGLINGQEKATALSRAWVLLNTSIHEGLPITFQESLAYGTPIVSALDPDQVTSRFGRYVGTESGDGLAAVPRFVAALRELLGSNELRFKLGTAGQEWVESVHTEGNFLRVFRRICGELRVRFPTEKASPLTQ